MSMSVVLLILGLLLFTGLVVVHELGHFIVARRNGITVEEFGIGFPPKLWTKKMRGFKLSINWLPLGGFVRLKGEHDADRTPGSFGAATTWVKTKVMLAGVIMNLVTALALLTLLALVGMPKIIEDQYTHPRDTKIIQSIENEGSVLISEVVANSPAAQVGLQKDDQLVKIADQDITNPLKVGEVTKKYAGQTTTVVVKRNGQLQPFQVKLNIENKNNQGFLGISSISGADGVEIRRSTWSAPWVAVRVTGQFISTTYKGLALVVSDLFHGRGQEATDKISGPVGIVVILREGSKIGLTFILMIIAVLSLTLALMNVLPIPALDGGRLFVMLVFRAIKKPLKKQTEEWIHGTGFALLMVLILLLTIVDVRRFF